MRLYLKKIFLETVEMSILCYLKSHLWCLMIPSTGLHLDAIWLEIVKVTFLSSLNIHESSFFLSYWGIKRICWEACLSSTDGLIFFLKAYSCSFPRCLICLYCRRPPRLQMTYESIACIEASLGISVPLRLFTFCLINQGLQLIFVGGLSL